MSLPQMLLIVGTVALLIVAFIAVAERIQATREALDREDPPMVDRSHGTSEWDWPEREAA